MKTNLKKTTINSLLIAIGFILHQLTPPILFGMKPDLSLIMMFIIIFLNKNYKTSLIIGILYGILTSMTTTFPCGQLGNLIDKILTSQIIYIVIKAFNNNFNNRIKLIIVTAIGTVISGLIFTSSIILLANINLPIESLIISVILPASILNSIIAPIIFNIIILSLRRSKINIF